MLGSRNSRYDPVAATRLHSFGRTLNSVKTCAYRARGGHRSRHKGREYERVAGPTKTIGYTLLARVQAELGLRRPVEEVLAEVFGDPLGPNLTFREAVPLYLEYATPRKKATTIAADGPRLNYAAKEGWAKLPLRDITQRDVSRFVTKLLRAGPRGKPCATSTVNRYLAAISGLYRWAIREGYAKENPTRGIERWNETGNARETYLDADEARALIAAAPERFRTLIAFAIGTGCRRNEVRSFRWRDVNWKRAEVHIRAENSKTNRGRPVPLTSDLVARLKALQALQAARRIDGDECVFQTRDGVQWSVQAVRRDFAKAVDTCGALAAFKARSLRFHDLRHTYASLAIQNGVPLHTVSRILGHSSIQTTMRYAHWCGEDRQKAARAVENALRGGGVN